MAQALRCSFCGKSAAEIEKLVAGPAGIHICNECVTLCQVIMAGEDEALEPNFDPTRWPKERLLALLGPVNGAAELHRQHLQGIVETLRAQKVSWAVIARQLGVSRQTAWERFS